MPLSTRLFVLPWIHSPSPCPWGRGGGCRVPAEAGSSHALAQLLCAMNAHQGCCCCLAQGAPKATFVQVCVAEGSVERSPSLYLSPQPTGELPQVPAAWMQLAVWAVCAAGYIQGTNHVKCTPGTRIAWLVGGSCDSVQAVAAVMCHSTACFCSAWSFPGEIGFCRGAEMPWKSGRKNLWPCA